MRARFCVGVVTLSIAAVFAWGAPAMAWTPPMVSAGEYHSVGLRSDGTVVAVGNNAFGQTDVSSWSRIIAVSAGGHHTLGLRDDGTVVAVGNDFYGQTDVASWTGIIAISAGERHSVGLRADGTVVAAGDNALGQTNVSSWSSIIAVSAGGEHTVGLKSDGTVVAVGSDTFGQTDVSSWNGIVAVSAGYYLTAGLKSDGTAVGVGMNDRGQTDVAAWTGITAVSADLLIAGLTADGTVVVTGGTRIFESWEEIVGVSVGGGTHILGLRRDGSVVAGGSDRYGQLAVDSWYLGPMVPGDVTPPEITASVAEGITYRAPIEVRFSAADAVEGPVSASATLNGQPFTSGTTITSPGPYALAITAADSVPNSRLAIINFTVIDVSDEGDPPIVSTPASAWWSLAALTFIALGGLKRR